MTSSSEHVRRERGLECSPSPHSLFSRNPDARFFSFCPFYHFTLLVAIIACCILTSKMDHSCDAGPHPKSGIGDLPDEVFVLILMLLPFPDQVRVRRVSTYWRTAVHYLFGKQEKVRISLQEEEKFENETRDWELRCSGFNFDSGVHIVITYPPGTCLPDNPDKRQAVTRFCGAVEFAIQHLDGTRIASVSWGFETYKRYPTSSAIGIFNAAREFQEQDRDRMYDVCNRFALRFQNQLQCFVSPMFCLTLQHAFPVLKHLTLMGVRQDIRNMFQTVTPKLVSLWFDSEYNTGNDIHPDNFKHLPADFRCLSLPQTRSGESLVHLHRCRKAIQSIRFTGFKWPENRSNPIRFPSLRYLKLWTCGLGIKENILTVNAAGLQHLHLTTWSEAYRLPAHVVFHNLLTLIIDCDCEILLDILSRTSHRLEQLTVIRCYGLTGRIFFTTLSDIKFLTILKISCSIDRESDTITEQSFTDSVLMLLRGGSRSTLKHFKFATNFPISSIQAGEIAAEMRLMQESESLESGIVDDKMIDYNWE